MKKLLIALTLITSTHESRANSTIWGGTSVSSNDPIALYSVALGILGNNGTRKHCSASLISKHHILTASHCIKLTNAKEYDVRFGTSANEPIQISKVSVQYLHPDYIDSWPQKSDIAILEFDQEAPSGFLPIQVNADDSFIKLKKPNAIVSGYGANQIGLLYQYQYDLRKTKLNPYLANAQYYQFHQSTGGACNGDSGGPLVVFKDELPVVVGISQAGSKIDNQGRCPGTMYFTSVSLNFKWIKQTLLKSTRHPVEI